MASTPAPTLTVALTPEQREEALAREVARGLTARRRSLPGGRLWDERGRQLRRAVTAAPSYYPARAERAAVSAHADAIAHLSDARSLVELGAGTSGATRLVLEALHRSGTLRRVVGVDPSEAAVRERAVTLAADYPGVAVAGVVGDAPAALPEVPDRLVALLGGQLGRLEPPARRATLEALAAGLGPDDTVLVGADLVHDPGRVLAAYDDPQRAGEALEKHVLEVVNDHLDADFDPEAFAYRARWSDDDQRVELGMVARGGQDVRIGALDLTVELEDGEEIHTGANAAFRIADLAGELAAAGLDPVHAWTDAGHDHAVLLSRPLAAAGELIP